MNAWSIDSYLQHLYLNTIKNSLNTIRSWIWPLNKQFDINTNYKSNIFFSNIAQCFLGARVLQFIHPKVSASKHKKTTMIRPSPFNTIENNTYIFKFICACRCVQNQLQILWDIVIMRDGHTSRLLEFEMSKKRLDWMACVHSQENPIHPFSKKYW